MNKYEEYNKALKLIENLRDEKERVSVMSKSNKYFLLIHVILFLIAFYYDSSIGVIVLNFSYLLFQNIKQLLNRKKYEIPGMKEYVIFALIFGILLSMIYYKTVIPLDFLLGLICFFLLPILTYNELKNKKEIFQIEKKEKNFTSEDDLIEELNNEIDKDMDTIKKAEYFLIYSKEEDLVYLKPYIEDKITKLLNSEGFESLNEYKIKRLNPILSENTIENI